MKNQTSIILFAVIILVGYFLIKLIDTDNTSNYIPEIKVKGWTLFLFSSSSPDTDYQTHRIDGYSSSQECVQQGLASAPVKGSYECGLDCKGSKPAICKRVCGRNGCRE